MAGDVDGEDGDEDEDLGNLLLAWYYTGARPGRHGIDLLP